MNSVLAMAGVATSMGFHPYMLLAAAAAFKVLFLVGLTIQIKLEARTVIKALVEVLTEVAFFVAYTLLMFSAIAHGVPPV